MGDNSGIEWTDATWNPVRGCVKVSPGCKHCYAETFAERWRGVPGNAYEQGFDPRLVPEMLDQPLRWQKPRTIFVNSMSDLFGEFVPDDYLAATFGVMAATRHTYQVLTKRGKRLPEWFGWVERVAREHYPASYPLNRDGDADDSPPTPRSVGWHVRQYTALKAREFAVDPPTGSLYRDADRAWPLPNVWLGVSVEDRKYGMPRIEHLRQTPAAVRFLSVEPLLEDIGEINLDGIGWVIVGGESGLGAREMRPEWVRSIRDQCVAAGVPFFFKQWGGVRKKIAGRVLDGRTWDEMPARAA